ncbi:putative lipid II flippase MurJ [Rhodovastum atsumiense]|uniref:Probable lipid II flippase MurJ n=1 Tax=Rhodovastum atsumiense TaxID=504468 RepID=A0A5M6IY22_9PROT|nr:murein biosynthesis integral membrane protein MurJ [Rhodovastum atsumiense]KAA5613171.1 murein biosynthesis integral membrane protein MurJ [Rhodovastum atsumiense]CAH2600680.1 putative lipid II flippase MurJ [Rhodovastum atsumiense]
MLRSILTVGGWTMVSRVLGFLRDILIAAMLGAGPVADAFFLANRLPNLFRRLFGEGAFNAAFVPGFAGVLASEGPAAARRFAEEALAVMTFWLLGLTVLAEIFMPQIMGLYALGFTDEPEKFALVVELARITFPYMPLICLTALLSGVLNGLDRFAAAAAAPVIYNVVSIGFMLALPPFVPTVGHALSWGVSVSGVAQIVLLYWAVRRAGMSLRLPRPRLTPQMRLLFRRMGPGLLGSGVIQLNLAVDAFISGLLPAGTVSVIYYADRVNQLPLGVIGVAVGTALLPTLSRQVRGGEPGQAVTTLNRAIEFALLLTLPAALALVVAALPIVSVLFGRGAFTPEDAQRAAEALAAYAVGLPAFVLVKVLVPAFFARGDTKAPVWTGTLAVVVNLALNFALMGPLQHMGPPLSSSIAAWFNVVLLAWLLHRRGHLATDAELRRRVPRMLAAGLAMTAVLWMVERTVFAALGGSFGLRWVALALLVSAGLAAYGVAGQLLGGFDLRKAAQAVLRRRRAPAE